MRSHHSDIALLALALGWLVAASPLVAAGPQVLVGWNNLGMHCMDSDYAVFSILPPYNTIHAQLVDRSGRLLGAGDGYSVTYEASLDAAGSIDSTSAGKTNFWAYVQDLFGTAPAVDVGLKGMAMPGGSNLPQAMNWDAGEHWWIAEGIPITPTDDRGQKNFYPMFRLVARDSSGAVVAETRIVLPVSDEMSCTTCHASGGSSAAKPAAGWVFDPNPDRDYRLNVLRLHDERRGSSIAYQTSLANAGYRADGLYATVVTGHKAVLCAACHGSEALAGSGQAGIPPLTTSVHGLHAHAVDPVNGLTLDASANRSACYRCHPGSTTRCLRGAMGNAVAADGTLAMQCQSCHGSMSTVGAASRTGWLDEPTCQSCHTGTATRNSGQIRFTSALDGAGQPRQAADPTFATNANAPAAGLSLYRFSFGHGGLACEACHGSTHAELASSQANDNVQSTTLQGHQGMLVECTACHAAVPSTVSGGPHGLHPVGQAWIDRHGDAAEGHTGTCQGCHGGDYRGTVLSRSQADRTVTTELGTKTFWRGFQISCWTCHDGPNSESASHDHPAVVQNVGDTTAVGLPVALSLPASDPDGDALTLRIVSQPAHGTVGLVGTTATYFPEAGFSGDDAFTFAAWDGWTDSNLGRATMTVTGGGGGGGGLPIAPSGLAAVATSSTRVRLTWQDNSGNETGFLIERRQGTGSFQQVATAPANATSARIGRLRAGATYGFRVRAANANGTSDYSNEVSVTMPRR